MALTDILIVFGILIFLGLLIWARVTSQRVLDCLNEIREFMAGWEVVPESQLSR